MGGYLKGPWRCSVCGGIYESLDEPSSGKGRPGLEPEYVCKSCYSGANDFSEDESSVT